MISSNVSESETLSLSCITEPKYQRMQILLIGYHLSNAPLGNCKQACINVPGYWISGKVERSMVIKRRKERIKSCRMAADGS